MAKMIIQLDPITKHIMRPPLTGNHKNVIAVRAVGNDDDATFEALYNEEVQYIGNQMVGS